MDVHSELTGMSGVLTNSEFAVRKRSADAMDSIC